MALKGLLEIMGISKPPPRSHRNWEQINYCVQQRRLGGVLVAVHNPGDKKKGVQGEGSAADRQVE